MSRFRLRVSGSLAVKGRQCSTNVSPLYRRLQVSVPRIFRIVTSRYWWGTRAMWPLAVQGNRKVCSCRELAISSRFLATLQECFLLRWQYWLFRAISRFDTHFIVSSLSSEHFVRLIASDSRDQIGAVFVCWLMKENCIFLFLEFGAILVWVRWGYGRWPVTGWFGIVVLYVKTLRDGSWELRDVWMLWLIGCKGWCGRHSLGDVAIWNSIVWFWNWNHF